MREVIEVLLVSAALIFLTFILVFAITPNLTFEFTFSEATLSFNGDKVVETLVFYPNKFYHTLYRNFIIPVKVSSNCYKNCILIERVECSDGIPYAYGEVVRTYTNSTTYYTNIYSHIEKNEYGCTFGNIEGFSPNKRYWIRGYYKLVPKKVFEYEGKYYIKFVAYSGYNHPTLVVGKNFFINGNVTYKKIYFSNDDVIIYVPISSDKIPPTASIEKISSLDFSAALFNFKTLFPFLPILWFFIVWYFFGKEKTKKFWVPPALTDYPKKRKGWEVAAFFNPPFMVIDKNFFASILLELKMKNIIDLKSDKKNVKIKILKKKGEDEVETTFIEFLRELKKIVKNEDGYFDINKAIEKVQTPSSIKSRYRILETWKKLNKVLKSKSKEYIDSSGEGVFIIPYIIYFVSLYFINVLSLGFIEYYSMGVALFLLFYSRYRGILCRFKKNYYEEFVKWQAFKNFLKKFSLMRRYPPEALVMWDEYLIYATALGVGEKVLNKFKEIRVIDKKKYRGCISVFRVSSHIYPVFSSGPGGGGLGGGGIGGGGGGGR